MDRRHPRPWSHQRPTFLPAARARASGARAPRASAPSFRCPQPGCFLKRQRSAFPGGSATEGCRRAASHVTAGPASAPTDAPLARARLGTARRRRAWRRTRSAPWCSRSARRAPPPPAPRTDRTRLVPPPVLIGHASSGPAPSHPGVFPRRACKRRTLNGGPDPARQERTGAHARLRALEEEVAQLRPPPSSASVRPPPPPSSY
jgi:hypothetical protein